MRFVGVYLNSQPWDTHADNANATTNVAASIDQPSAALVRDLKQGYAHGGTDDFGYESIHEVVTMHDLHATLLHALGLDHQRLTFDHEGRQETLTDADLTRARVVRELLA